MSQEDRILINNGCGPAWFPLKAKRFIDRHFMAWMFDAGCGHHDFGYIVGGGELRRWMCDLKLAKAMLNDVKLCFKHGDYNNFIIGLFSGTVFYIALFLFGWTSFEYGRQKSRGEVIAYARFKHGETSFIQRLKRFRWK